MADRLPRWTLKPRERRVVLVGAVIASLILGYVYGVEPLLKARADTRTRLQAARLRVDRYELLLARRDRVEQEVRDLEAKSAALRDRLLPGPTPPLAAAQLQGIVKAEAQQAALAVQRITVERPALTGRIAEVPVHLTLKGEIGQVSAFIRRIEQHRLALSIPELTIQVQDPKNPRELIVDLVLAGHLILPEESPPAGRPTTNPTPTKGPAQ